MWILFSVLVVSVVCANIDDISVEISTFARADDLVIERPPPEIFPPLRARRQDVGRRKLWPYFLIIFSAILVGIALMIILDKIRPLTAFRLLRIESLFCSILCSVRKEILIMMSTRIILVFFHETIRFIPDHCFFSFVFST
jgi:hypothetical protein